MSGIQSVASSWIGQSSLGGAQIDLIPDRSDRVINLFEMRKKISVFREQTKTRKAIFLTMITTFGLSKNTYSISTVQNELTMEDLFEP